MSDNWDFLFNLDDENSNSSVILSSSNNYNILINNTTTNESSLNSVNYDSISSIEDSILLADYLENQNSVSDESYDDLGQDSLTGNNERSKTQFLENIAFNYPLESNTSDLQAITNGDFNITDSIDDTANLNQGETATINVLDNDSDIDGTIIPTSLQIQTQPDNGTTIARPDGTISYLPNSGFAGNDSFTYVVQDNDGQLSNPATVNLSINNVAPVINNIQLPATIIEGTEITIDGDVTDPGNDQLSYTWNFGDDTPQLTVLKDTASHINSNQLSVSHTFIDNGIYNATLTVTDPERNPGQSRTDFPQSRATMNQYKHRQSYY